jgi:hypothetical protein
MREALLQTAYEQAKHSERGVRAAALVHIARVLAASDQAAAEDLLEQGIALVREIDGPGSEHLFANAVYLAATVSPKHALTLYAEHKGTAHFGVSVMGLVNAMAGHGHIRDAISYLNNPLPGDHFLFEFLGNLDGECRDDETRLQLLDSAIRAWGNRSPVTPDSRDYMVRRAFTGFLGRYWNLVPPQVAAPVLREVAQLAHEAKSDSRRFSMTGQPGDLELTMQESELFWLFPALLSLAPDVARFVLQGRPQLAAAVERFPLGWQSIRNMGPKFDLARDDAMMVGNSGIIPMREVLADDFKAAFREANKQLAEERDQEGPNEAPKECWPAAWEFRNILFKAGQHLGMAAEMYLERVPDPDLRLFAQIELCAAMAGLPQMPHVTVRHSAAARKQQLVDLERMFGPVLPGIRCPKCKWTPRAKNIWACKCGHRWNTFDTRGRCPGCSYQWEVTGCLQCGASSAHQGWYETK